MCFIFCCRRGRRTKNDLVQAAAQKKLDNDLDIIQIVDSIYKIKATLKVLMANNSFLVGKIEKAYQDDKLAKFVVHHTEYS